LSILEWLHDETNGISTAIAQSCKEHRCSLKVDGISNCVIVKPESLGDDGSKMCDCIAFWQRQELVVAVVELKSKAGDARDIVKQLQNGCNRASEWVRSSGEKVDAFNWLPAILAKGWRSLERKVLRNCRVRIGKARLPIMAKRCGTHISQIVGE